MQTLSRKQKKRGICEQGKQHFKPYHALQPSFCHFNSIYGLGEFFVTLTDFDMFVDVSISSISNCGILFWKVTLMHLMPSSAVIWSSCFAFTGHIESENRPVKFVLRHVITGAMNIIHYAYSVSLTPCTFQSSELSDIFVYFWLFKVSFFKTVEITEAHLFSYSCSDCQW